MQWSEYTVTLKSSFIILDIRGIAKKINQQVCLSQENCKENKPTSSFKLQELKRK